jgi:hypothetical protein
VGRMAKTIGKTAALALTAVTQSIGEGDLDW